MTEWNKLLDQMVNTKDPSAAVCVDCQRVVFLVKEGECPDCGKRNLIAQYTVRKQPLH